MNGKYQEEEKDRQKQEPLQRACLVPNVIVSNFAQRQVGAEGPHRPTHHDAVIPRENGQFVKTGDKVPPGGDVARDEDPKGEDRKGVHESR